jgi:hypothetical protein
LLTDPFLITAFHSCGRSSPLSKQSSPAMSGESAPCRKRDRGAPHTDCLTLSASKPEIWASGVYTELQCGSYIFMDADYGRNLDRDGAPTKAFEPAFICGRP